MMFFFFKQKTAYEIRIMDWSSDVCSSDLPRRLQVQRQGIALHHQPQSAERRRRIDREISDARADTARRPARPDPLAIHGDEKVRSRRFRGLPRPASRYAGRPEAAPRSDERRVGKECVRTCRTRWAP